MAVERDISLLNPLVTTRSGDRAVRSLMFESLADIDEQGNIKPKLAESWDVSPDGKIYTFHLRRSVRFHGGQEMTAGDVAFAMEYTMNPRNGAYGYTTLSVVDRVETTDTHTVRVYLKKAAPSFISALTDIRPFPIVPKDSVEEGVDKPAAFPPGTGPFKFVEWQPRQRIVLARHEDYWGQKAYVDRLMLRPISDASVRMTALRAGDVDVIEKAPYEWVRQIAEGRVDGVRATEVAYGLYRTLLFNVADPPFNNKKLREAVAHAIDKREILQAAYFGFGWPTDQKYPPGHTWQIDGLASRDYDPERARALLAEAGYRGETIAMPVNQSGFREAEATTLQAQLRKVGITLRLEILEAGAYVDRQRKGDFAFTFYGGTFNADPSPTYGTDLMCEQEPGKRGENVAGYCDAAMDDLLRRAETELDHGRRKQLFRQVLTKMLEDMPELPIGFVPEYYALRDHLRGFTTSGLGHFMHHGGGLNYTWLDK
jgi:peptide/nickel transport system substrate-binding protein